MCFLVFQAPGVKPSLRLQPRLIRFRYHVRYAKKRVSHVVAEANETRLYSQARLSPSLHVVSHQLESQTYLLENK